MSNSQPSHATAGRTIPGLKVPPFNTTLMGVVRGIADHQGVDASDAALFGLTGHAFLINIHDELCPSGPYCWKPERFRGLLRNLGIAMKDEGFFSPESTRAQREEMDAFLRDCIDHGVPCSLLNMENQLITGYDDTGFFTTRPWVCVADFPPARLEFGTWREFGELFHTSFFTFSKVAGVERRRAIAESLRHAVDLHRHPRNHTSEPYGAGPQAFVKWIAAIGSGYGDTHGNWWNGVVWAECRAMASAYLREIADAYPAHAALATELAADYAAIAAGLGKVADKGLDPSEKTALLKDIAEREARCIAKIERLAGMMG